MRVFGYWCADCDGPGRGRFINPADYDPDKCPTCQSAGMSLAVVEVYEYSAGPDVVITDGHTVAVGIDLEPSTGSPLEAEIGALMIERSKTREPDPTVKVHGIDEDGVLRWSFSASIAGAIEEEEP